MSTRIRFLDLSAPHRDLRDELRSVFDTTLDTSQFVGGATVQTFDQDFTEVISQTGARFDLVDANAVRAHLGSREHRG